MPAVTRRQYKGAAAQTTITNALASGDTTITISANTGWPSTAAVPFFVVVSPGTSSEEKCLATISGTTLTLTRAQDDTSAQSHSSGATIYPVFSADDADEANKLASTLTTRGDLLTMGAGPDFSRIALGASGTVLKSDGTDASWATIVAANIASDAVTTAKIQDDAVTTAKILNANVTGAKLANLPINDQTASYTLVVADRNKRVIMNVASANTVTVNNSIFAEGDTIFIANKGAGASTVTAGMGVTINSTSGLELAQYQSGTLVALSASSFLFFESDGGSITTATATVATSQSTTSTTYTDLATAGPAVTLTTGTKVLVFTNTEVSTSGGRYVFADFAISGATTRAASDDTCVKVGDDPGTTQNRQSVCNLMTVTAGSNTFTMKYRVNAGTNSFVNRSIVVVAL